MEIGLLFAVFSLPGEVALVGHDTSNKCGAIVATEANEHNANSGHDLFGRDGFLLKDGALALRSLIEESEAVFVSDIDPGVILGALNAWHLASGHLLKGVSASGGCFDGLHDFDLLEKVKKLLVFYL